MYISLTKNLLSLPVAPDDTGIPKPHIDSAASSVLGCATDLCIPGASASTDWESVCGNVSVFPTDLKKQQNNSLRTCTLKSLIKT